MPVEMASHFHILGCIASFVDQATMHPAWSPACGKLLGTECDTHTHTLPTCNLLWIPYAPFVAPPRLPSPTPSVRGISLLLYLYV